MNHLTGEYYCKLDAKGRFRMPAGLIRQIGDGGTMDFTVHRGFEKNLNIYPQEVWDRKANEINQKLSVYKKKQRQVIRYFFRGASKVSLDGADRILLPKGLIDHAGLESDIILFAYRDIIEIWSKENYEKELAQEPDNFDEVADEVFSDIDGLL